MKQIIDKWYICKCQNRVNSYCLYKYEGSYGDSLIKPSRMHKGDIAVKEVYICKDGAPIEHLFNKHCTQDTKTYTKLCEGDELNAILLAINI